MTSKTNFIRQNRKGLPIIIQLGNPSYNYLILTLRTYHLFLKHKLLNVHRRAMDLYIKGGTHEY